MRAIDTNIVVRFLTGDDRSQAKAVRTLMAEGEIFVPTTVLLESEWVLRGAYGFSRERIAEALRDLAGLPGVNVETPALLARALGFTAEGMDFADALHLTKAEMEGCTAFLSFDRKLAKSARAGSSLRVETP